MTIEEFKNTNDWEQFVEDTHPNDAEVEKIYEKISNKPSCVTGCGYEFDDIHSFYEAETCQYSERKGVCIHCASK